MNLIASTRSYRLRLVDMYLIIEWDQMYYHQRYLCYIILKCIVHKRLNVYLRFIYV